MMYIVKSTSICMYIKGVVQMLIYLPHLGNVACGMESIQLIDLAKIIPELLM